MPQDVTGREIKLGDTLSYPVRHGAIMNAQLGVVREIGNDYIKVDKMTTRVSYVWDGNVCVAQKTARKILRVKLTADTSRMTIVTKKLSLFKGIGTEIIRYMEKE